MAARFALSDRALALVDPEEAARIIRTGIEARAPMRVRYWSPIRRAIEA